MKGIKRLLAGLMCAALLLLNGCEFRDIDLRLFVVAIGVDLIEDNPGMTRFSFKISIPIGDPKSGEEKSMVITQDSSTIANAVRQLKSKVDKEVDFGHCKAILYGEAYARQGVEKVEDWAIRRRDIQLLLYPGVARPSAEAVLNVVPPTERIAGNSLFLALSSDGTESPFIVKTFSFELSRRMREKGKDPVIPVVEAEGDTMLIIDKAALLDKKKVVEILSPEETKLLNLLTRNDLRTNFPAMTDGVHYDLNIMTTKARYQIMLLRREKRLSVTRSGSGETLRKRMNRGKCPSGNSKKLSRL
ncbi:Ger(x)C family spore germination protein [Paenibacillus sp. DMB20]|uniref:Ger(x)C family spore germination protein n=1 Tax=Paenibacillus sp. DMB20 TaxID=1642570 RepID=UPI000A5BCD5A|nr:Ger(x)C family spore germination protein [Paenibacillus sp. DMB20]